MASCKPRGKFIGIERCSLPMADHKAIVIPLRCNKYGCEICGKRKFKQLLARALNGLIAQPVDGYRPKYSHKLLTLTCPGKEYRACKSIEDAIDDMAYCFNKLTRALQKKFGKFIYLRVIEDQRDGFPHYHVILRGGVIAPKAILAEIRHLWTDLYGMGNVDIQTMKSNSVREMILYALKYVSKNPPLLPKGKRIYSASRAALAPVTKKGHDWLAFKVLPAAQCKLLFEEPESYGSRGVYGLGFEDPDVHDLVLEYWHDGLYRGIGNMSGNDDLGPEWRADRNRREREAFIKAEREKQARAKQRQSQPGMA